ncbi:hypothetical protein M5689_024086 [Euphorbia peplus]|nr:hypothetical protein M5689_024086 [Euphorbia peplus]
MDFHSLKRKRLQCLCKKHGIPANKTTLQMADFLTLALKGKGNSILKECTNGKNYEGEHKKVKKVRFSPDIETREYEPSRCKMIPKRRRRPRRRRTIRTSSSSKNKSKKSILPDEVGDKKRGRGNGKIGIASCTRRAQAEADKEVSFVMKSEIKIDKDNEGVSYVNIHRDDRETRKGVRRSARIGAKVSDPEVVNGLVKSDDNEARIGVRRSARIGAKSDPELVNDGR